jgi:glycosyltransferase involved in cell wall biosynthesis
MTDRVELSVVVPAFNAESTIGLTLSALADSVDHAAVAAEVVVVDDGSTDATADVAKRVLEGRLPLTLVQQPNRGRFEARRAGIEAASADTILLLDSRVFIERRALAFVLERRSVAPVWTSHVIVVGSSPLARFWALIAELAWSDYFDDPRTVSFGAAEFDRYPKGTTCFLAPRTMLLDAIAAFRSVYADVRDANDDTPLLRWIAEREPIHVSPGFQCTYEPRTSLSSFGRHAVHRGVVFVDGHARSGSRFRAAALAFFPISVAATAWAVRRPGRVVVLGAAVAALASGLGIAKRRGLGDVASLALVAPIYGVCHALGMWKGAVLAVGKRVRGH